MNIFDYYNEKKEERKEAERDNVLKQRAILSAVIKVKNDGFGLGGWAIFFSLLFLIISMFLSWYVANKVRMLLAFIFPFVSLSGMANWAISDRVVVFSIVYIIFLSAMFFIADKIYEFFCWVTNGNLIGCPCKIENDACPWRDKHSRNYRKNKYRESYRK